MKHETRRLDILRISSTGAVKERDLVVREAPVTIFLNDVDLVTLLCSPKDLEYLAVGFLFAEGLIKRKEDVKSIIADNKDGVVWVETVEGKKIPDNILARRFITTGCGKGLSFIDSPKPRKGLKAKSGFKMHAGKVALLMKEFQERSKIYRKTGGVHSAGLANARGIVAFNEDIGRHNAIDKILGECVLKGIKTDGLILMTSGRVSSDLLVKAARARIPFIVSRSAPTDLSVRLARDLGITLVGFARGSRMNVYSNERRIVAGPRAR
ncbi:MAG: formate dehydrogenase family accessory protein FdhD [Euryarchaeota archaeon RBG_19FT_COMBO_56_21]|nr:MAG: formate dehydrogenase family accessory protein FdhD [Euryarchaeota archaeon RBG_19FT_COMBO_56_21]